MSNDPEPPEGLDKWLTIVNKEKDADLINAKSKVDIAKIQAAHADTIIAAKERVEISSHTTFLKSQNSSYIFYGCLALLFTLFLGFLVHQKETELAKHLMFLLGGLLGGSGIGYSAAFFKFRKMQGSAGNDD